MFDQNTNLVTPFLQRLAAEAGKPAQIKPLKHHPRVRSTGLPVVFKIGMTKTTPLLEEHVPVEEKRVPIIYDKKAEFSYLTMQLLRCSVDELTAIFSKVDELKQTHQELIELLVKTLHLADVRKQFIKDNGAQIASWLQENQLRFETAIILQKNSPASIEKLCLDYQRQAKNSLTDDDKENACNTKPFKTSEALAHLSRVQKALNEFLLAHQHRSTAWIPAAIVLNRTIEGFERLELPSARKTSSKLCSAPPAFAAFVSSVPTLPPICREVPRAPLTIRR